MVIKTVQDGLRKNPKEKGCEVRKLRFLHSLFNFSYTIAYKIFIP